MPTLETYKKQAKQLLRSRKWTFANTRANVGIRTEAGIPSLL